MQALYRPPGKEKSFVNARRKKKEGKVPRNIRDDRKREFTAKREEGGRRGKKMTPGRRTVVQVVWKESKNLVGGKEGGTTVGDLDKSTRRFTAGGESGPH